MKNLYNETFSKYVADLFLFAEEMWIVRNSPALHVQNLMFVKNKNVVHSPYELMLESGIDVCFCLEQKFYVNKIIDYRNSNY